MRSCPRRVPLLLRLHDCEGLIHVLLLASSYAAFDQQALYGEFMLDSGFGEFESTFIWRGTGHKHEEIIRTLD